MKAQSLQKEKCRLDFKGSGCKAFEEYRIDMISGGYSGKATPVPIPNTAVKLSCADDTWRETARESKSLPVLLKKESSIRTFFFISRILKLKES